MMDDFNDLMASFFTGASPYKGTANIADYVHAYLPADKNDFRAMGFWEQLAQWMENTATKEQRHAIMFDDECMLGLSILDATDRLSLLSRFSPEDIFLSNGIFSLRFYNNLLRCAAPQCLAYIFQQPHTHQILFEHLSNDIDSLDTFAWPLARELSKSYIQDNCAPALNWVMDNLPSSEFILRAVIDEVLTGGTLDTLQRIATDPRMSKQNGMLQRLAEDPQILVPYWSAPVFHKLDPALVAANGIAHALVDDADNSDGTLKQMIKYITTPLSALDRVGAVRGGIEKALGYNSDYELPETNLTLLMNTLDAQAIAIWQNTPWNFDGANAIAHRPAVLRTMIDHHVNGNGTTHTRRKM